MQFKKALLALAVSAALPATAVAQSPAVTDPVTVTAKGFEALVADTPRSVNIITAEEIAFTDARTLGDLLIGQPGIAVATDGSVGLDPIIRGLKRDQVVVLIDGARVNAFQPAARGSLAAYVNVDLIERIEVIRGPSSVLYGTGAMGGVINIITKSGGYSETPTNSGWVRLGATSADQGFRTAAGTSFANPNTVFDLGIAFMNTEDYRMGNGERLRDSGTEQRSFHANFKRQLDQRQELQLRVQRDERRDVWFLASRRFNPENNELRPKGINTHNAPYQYRTLIGADYSMDLDNQWDSRMILAAYTQRLERGNYDFSSRLNRQYATSDPVFDNHGASIKFSAAPSENQFLITGLDWQRLTSSPTRCNTTSGYVPEPEPCSPNITNGELNLIGVFAQNEISYGDYIIDLGARYDYVKGDADFATSGGNLERTDNTFSWSIGVLRNVDPAFNPYINISQGYRAAGLLERFLTFPYSDGFTWLADPQLEPERNRTLEFGVRGAIGQTQYSLALYQSDISDYIGARVLPESMGFKQTQNISKARIRGMEYTLQHDLGDSLSIYSWGTWLQGDNLDPQFNEPLTQMPPAELSVGIAKQPARGLNWRGQIRAVAKQDRVAPEFNGVERTTPGFATIDASLGYRFGPSMGFNSSELLFSITNLLDKDYREHVNEMTEAGLDDPGVQDLLRPGRSFGLTWYATF